MQIMPDTTLVLLVKRSYGEISEICLAMKKGGFGEGRCNGVGGKLEVGETIEQAAVRETREEVGVENKEMKKCARLVFENPHKPEWDQVVHVYLVENWEGEPSESIEMKPEWFAVKDIPYTNMWPDDAHWLPEVLNGNL
jgi:mutator protein MutT